MLISTKQLAEIHGLNASTIWNWCKTYGMPHFTPKKGVSKRKWFYFDPVVAAEWIANLGTQQERTRSTYLKTRDKNAKRFTFLTVRSTTAVVPLTKGKYAII